VAYLLAEEEIYFGAQPLEAKTEGHRGMCQLGLAPLECESMSIGLWVQWFGMQESVVLAVLGGRSICRQSVLSIFAW
jgi:hypothetical protein